MIRTRGTLAALTLSAVACTQAGSPVPVPAPVAQSPEKPQPTTTAPASTSDLQTINGFNARVREYAALHNKLETTLPVMATDTSPQLIDKHQRGLEQLMVVSRAAAKRGDIFTPDAERLFRRVLGQVFAGADGRQLKATIMDEHTADVKLAVNARYPDQIPLSTMPPQVLAVMPKLPDELEYRFIGARLILLDVHAHIVVDYIDNALPQ